MCTKAWRNEEYIIPIGSIMIDYIHLFNFHIALQFTRDSIDVYICGIYNGILDLDLFTLLEEVTQG